jgi:GT2 family glycosyltransferase
MEATQQEQQAPELAVSAVIVSRNSIAALRKCVGALERSDMAESIEVIVADNASRDGSQRIDAEFPKVAPLRLQHHVGLTKARNIAIRTARAEFLLLLSPDVVVEPDTIRRLVERLRAESGAFAVCPTLVGPDGQRLSRAAKLPSAEQVSAAWSDPASLLSPAEPGPVEVHDGKAILIRKHTIQGINYLDERYGEHWGDVELAFQIRRAGKKILLADDIRASLNTTDPLWTPSAGRERAAYSYDAANGAAAYIAKHNGFAAGLGFRLKMLLATLVKVLTFQDAGANLGLLNGLLSGSKIDGKDRSM